MADQDIAAPAAPPATPLSQAGSAPAAPSPAAPPPAAAAPAASMAPDVPAAGRALPPRQSALDGLVPPLEPAPQAGLRLAELPHTAKLILRGERAVDAFRHATAAVVGTEPPPGPEAWIGRDGTAILGLGPDEWLIIGPPGAEARLEPALRRALGEAGLRIAAVTDVTEAYTVIAASGPRLREVLAKGCPLDLHPRVVRPGFVGQSLLGPVDIILHLIADQESGGDPLVHLYVRRSFAAFLWEWLADAGLEHGVGPLAPG